MQNHFELFNLPQRFALDGPALDAAFREVQAKVHPDRHAHGSEADKRAAMQWATRANEAYQTLKNPMTRAAYLCELGGVDVATDKTVPPEFLQQQVEWRESLQEAKAEKNAAMLDPLQREWRNARSTLVQQVEARLDAKDFAKAAQGVRKWMFLEKFWEELRDAYEAIED